MLSVSCNVLMTWAMVSRPTTSAVRKVPAGCATQLLASQVIDHVEGQTEVFHFLHGGQHAGDADAVGNEVGGVLGTHHALAQGAGHEAFERRRGIGLLWWGC